ncbi:MAG: molybdopterin-dependent oxidoreductase [Clostridiales Family XIII bacterium]|jgi:anaerobic selenocysteine-containing dehydrogenase|nr:molybdopterin-dependent oxidoreductase [Clostridiales Family XIII bacterium]
MATEEKQVVCWASPGCKLYCGLIATIEDGKLVSLKPNPAYPSPNKGCADRLPHHIDWLYSDIQIKHPLKRVGERGEGKWEEISWEQALDEIAAKLAELKGKYGGETLSITEGTYRSDVYPIRTRFLNLFGNPSNIGCAGTICHCNTAALSFALIGTAQGGRHGKGIPKCTVIHGNDMSQTVPLAWKRLKKQHDDGLTKLILIDPRKTSMGDDVDMWLRIRPGTDTALLMGWIHIIIEEELYDKEFVDSQTFGFEELKERAKEYTPERVSEITWIPVEQIIESARIYATNWPAELKDASSTDMLGRNAIRVEQARVCLRALTGNFKPGGADATTGPGPIINGEFAVRDSMLQMADALPVSQRKKQIGAGRFKLMTWPGYEVMAPIYEKTYGTPFPMCAHNFLSVQPLIWKAILERDPYPITANITWGSNPLLNAGDVKLVYKALKSPNLELSVVSELVMTPTAMLADYVLPAASKLEKPMCETHEDFAPVMKCAERAIEPLGERHEEYLLWKGLADRLGFGEHFPWESEEELADYRLAPVGLTFKQAATEVYQVMSDEPWTYETISPYTGKPTGWATPSGKIELYSNVLKELGYDPLPFYEEPAESPYSTPELAKEYPLILTTGGNFRPMFHSENRQPGLGTREQYPDPIMDIHPKTAAEHGIQDGDWVYVETLRGVIKQKARVADEIDPRVVNVQSHWWFPEEPHREPWLGGLWPSNANVLTPADNPDDFDQVTGGWPLRALLCKVYKAEIIS